MPGIFGKLCSRCKKPYGGHGDTCATCRSLMKNGSTPIQKCQKCGSTYNGFRDTCSDCAGSSRSGSSSRSNSQSSYTDSEELDMDEGGVSVPMYGDTSAKNGAFLADTDSQANFRHYWALIKDFWKTHTEEQKALWYDPEVVDLKRSKQINAAMEQRAQTLQSEARVVIQKVFEKYASRHEGGDEQILNGEEINMFFLDYAEAQLEVNEFMAKCSAELLVMRANRYGDATGQGKVDQAQVTMLQKGMVEGLRKSNAAYRLMPRWHNFRAARAVDSEGYGQGLRYTDVVQAMLPGTKDNRRFTRRFPSLMADGVLPEWSAVKEARREGNLAHRWD